MIPPVPPRQAVTVTAEMLARAVRMLSEESRRDVQASADGETLAMRCYTALHARHALTKASAGLRDAFEVLGKESVWKPVTVRCHVISTTTPVYYLASWRHGKLQWETIEREAFFPCVNCNGESDWAITPRGGRLKPDTVHACDDHLHTTLTTLAIDPDVRLMVNRWRLEGQSTPGPFQRRRYATECDAARAVAATNSIVTDPEGRPVLPGSLEESVAVRTAGRLRLTNRAELHDDAGRVRWALYSAAMTRVLSSWDDLAEHLRQVGIIRMADATDHWIITEEL